MLTNGSSFGVESAPLPGGVGSLADEGVPACEGGVDEGGVWGLACACRPAAVETASRHAGTHRVATDRTSYLAEKGNGNSLKPSGLRVYLFSSHTTAA